jgi:hypothetical protein
MRNFLELATKYNKVLVLQRAAYFIELVAYPALESTDN